MKNKKEISNFFVIYIVGGQFMGEINGIDNEFEFVKYLNGKKIKQLNPMFRELIDYLYPNVNENSVIKSWRNHISQKTDVFIRVNGIMKGISIKKGSRNSVHIDRISDFIKFLLDNNVSKDIVNNYLLYHFADGTGKRIGPCSCNGRYAFQLYRSSVQSDRSAST